MFSFFKRNKEYKKLSAAPTMPPTGGTAVKTTTTRSIYVAPVESNSNYDSGPDIVDTIIAAEVISSIMSTDTSSYDNGSSYDSGSSDYSGGGGDFGGGGSDSSW